MAQPTRLRLELGRVELAALHRKLLVARLQQGQGVLLLGEGHGQEGEGPGDDDDEHGAEEEVDLVEDVRELFFGVGGWVGER